MISTPRTPPTATGARAPAPRQRNLTAVASGKGGVGKTLLSITLAHAMARQGLRTLLFDGDLGLANVDIQLGLTPERDLGGVIAGRLPLDQATMRFEDGKFDIIAGRSGTGNLATLPPNKLTALCAGLVSLASRYDAVIMDLGAGIDRTVRLLSSYASTCLVVTTPEPTSLTDAYAFLKVTHQSEPDVRLKVIVNAAETMAEGQRTYDTLRRACENFLKFTPPLAGIVRRDRKVADAIRHQAPLLTRHPESEAARDIEAIVERLLEAS